MAKTVLDVLKTHIEKLMESRKSALVNGSPKTFEQYREEVGVLKGLAMALTEIQDAKKMTGEEDDE